MEEINSINGRKSFGLLSFGIIAILVCSLLSCGHKNAPPDANEDVIAIGKYVAMLRDDIPFTLIGLEKAEYDDNIVYFNVSGTAAYPDGEIGNVKLIIEYNRYSRIIDLHFWGDFEIGIDLDIKQKWEECKQRENGVKQYYDEDVEEIREKANEYAQYIKSLED